MKKSLETLLRRDPSLKVRTDTAFGCGRDSAIAGGQQGL